MKIFVKYGKRSEKYEIDVEVDLRDFREVQPKARTSRFEKVYFLPRCFRRISIPFKAHSSTEVNKLFLALFGNFVCGIYFAVISLFSGADSIPPVLVVNSLKSESIQISE